jgi:4-amino-4-deoxy-L-arabinose transferase-like glycosyltransferase
LIQSDNPYSVARVSRTWVPLAIILALALGVRFSYLAADPHDPLSDTLDGELARNLVAGRGFVLNARAITYNAELRTRAHRMIDPADVNWARVDEHGEWEPEIVQPIGGGTLLAGVWEITGEHYLPMQIVQAIVDALCALLIYAIAMRLFRRRRAALAAAALYALYFPIAWQATVMYVDIWAVDFTIAIVAAYLRAIGSLEEHAADQRRWLVVCGLLTGAGVYFRPNLLILPACLALATIAVVGWRATLVRAAVPTVAALALIVPWTIHDYYAYHAIFFTRTGFGDNMFGGLGEIPNNYGFSVNDALAQEELHRERPDLRPHSPAWDNYLLTHWVVPAIEHHPLFYAEGVGRRLVRSTLLDYEGRWMRRGVTLPSGRSLAAFTSFVAAGHPLALLEDAYQPFIFLAAMLTLALTWGRFRRQHVFLIALLLSVLVPYIVIHLEPRYVLPGACAYVVWIGLGIDLLAERTSRRLAADPGATPPSPRAARSGVAYDRRSVR